MSGRYACPEQIRVKPPNAMPTAPHRLRPFRAGADLAPGGPGALKDYTGQYLRETIDGQAELLIGTRTYRVAAGECDPREALHRVLAHAVAAHDPERSASREGHAAFQAATACCGHCSRVTGSAAHRWPSTSSGTSPKSSSARPAGRAAPDRGAGRGQRGRGIAVLRAAAVFDRPRQLVPWRRPPRRSSASSASRSLKTSRRGRQSGQRPVGAGMETGGR